VFESLDMNWEDYVEIDPLYFRPAEVDILLGDPSKAEKKFGWKPKTTFGGLAKLMTEADLELAKNELAIAGR
jgi:GDPmannose 4,6-dehydratase